MLELVRRARRRVLHNELLCQTANASSALLAALILLLILGTEILSWYWLVIAPAVAAGIALYFVRKRIPTPYVTAQLVDRRMGLADCLSTAVYFGGAEGAGKGAPEIVRLHLEKADGVARGVDPRRAVPYVVPQTAYLAAALLLVASSVFALRYGLTDHLDLKQPLARILQQSFGFGNSDQRAKAETQKGGKNSQEADGDSAEGDKNLSNDPGQPQPDDLAADESQKPTQGEAKQSKNAQDQADSDSPDAGDQAEQAPADSKQQSAANQKDGQSKNGDSAGNQSANNSQNNNESLLSKMKDAMQNLLSSMQQSSNKQQQNAQSQNGKSGKNQQTTGKQQASKGEKKDGQQSDDGQEQEAGEGQEAQNAQGQASKSTDSAQANKQPGSGAGNRDGSKDLKLAEQLAAMGKISEIIGKRNANITGEATVDVQNTSQQLRTNYQDRQAQHAQAGAEINRDEVPVALESYVQQYFEQVRKQAKK